MTDIEAITAERDHLRAFLQFEPDPGPHAWAWCCHCQESHPIDRPHVSDEAHRERMDARQGMAARIRGLEAEVERLLVGDFTDTGVNILAARIKDQAAKIATWKARFKQWQARWVALVKRADGLTAQQAGTMQSLRSWLEATFDDICRHEVT